MRKILYFILLIGPLSASYVLAGSYGMYEAKRILVSPDKVADKKPGIDLRYVDQMLDDLGNHAANYPTQFDSLDDRMRAVRDVQMLSKVFDVLVDGPNSPPEIFRRAGFLYSIGHNLDIQGSAEKAYATFTKLLSIAPKDAQGNFMFGVFLGGSGRAKESISHLELALQGGVTAANYSLGMSYLALGDKEKALACLENYRVTNPADKSIDELIKHIKSGNFGVKNVTN